MAGREQSPAGGLPATTFFSKTFDEAVELTVEARDYLRDSAKSDARSLDAGGHLLLSSETLRLSSQLAEMMAWLLMQRAVHAGEMTAADGREQTWRLTGAKVRRAEISPGRPSLPPRLESLIERSQGLYRRIARLDELVMRDAG